MPQHSMLPSLFSDTKLFCIPFFKAVHCTKTDVTFVTGAVFLFSKQIWHCLFYFGRPSVNVSLLVNLGGTWAWSTPGKAVTFSTCEWMIESWTRTSRKISSHLTTTLLVDIDAMRTATLMRCRNSFLTPLPNCLGNSISIHHSDLTISSMCVKNVYNSSYHMDVLYFLHCWMPCIAASSNLFHLV